MSINDFLNKIKARFGIDKYIILCSFLIILVGILSFFLGRLSVISDTVKGDNQISIINRGVNVDTSQIPHKKYLASRGGSIYYPLNCSAGNRILNKNKIYFTTSQQATAAGYRTSSKCNY